MLYSYFRFGNFSIETFAERMVQSGLDDISELNSLQNFTFFIPVDSAFQVSISYYKELHISSICRTYKQYLLMKK